MSRNDDYTTGNLLNYINHQNIINALVHIYQDKQIRVFPQEINFVGKLEEADSATMIFCLW